MNKTRIDWCDCTINPVVGCPRGCEYCYAKKLIELLENNGIGYPRINQLASAFVESGLIFNPETDIRPKFKKRQEVFYLDRQNIIRQTKIIKTDCEILQKIKISYRVVDENSNQKYTKSENDLFATEAEALAALAKMEGK